MDTPDRADCVIPSASRIYFKFLILNHFETLYGYRTLMIHLKCIILSHFSYLKSLVKIYISW